MNGKLVSCVGMFLALALASAGCTWTVVRKETETTRPSAPRVIEERTTIERQAPPPVEENTTIIKKRSTETVE